MSTGKICFVASGNPFRFPYLSIYEEACLRSGRSWEKHLVYWDREGSPEEPEGYECHVFGGAIRVNSSPFALLRGYCGYWRYVNSVLRCGRFDKVVLLNTPAAYTAFPTVSNLYAGRYVLDVRDYGGENHLLLRAIEKRIIDNAKLACISSPYYRSFLPEFHYEEVHNLQEAPHDIVASIRSSYSPDKAELTIGFIGSVDAYIDQHMKLIDVFGNDKRFRLFFCGSGAEKLQPYCDEMGINNVILHGRFDPQEIFALHSEVDIIHNLYGNHNPYLDYALSNKLYLAAQFRMPILTCPDTAMADQAEKLMLGITVDLDGRGTYGTEADAESICDYVYRAWHDVDRGNLEVACDAFLDDCRRANERYQALLLGFLDE